MSLCENGLTLTTTLRERENYYAGSIIFSFFQYCNPLSDMPILGSSNSAANKDMMAKIWTNGDTIICMSRKHCGKRRNCSLRFQTTILILIKIALSFWET